MLTTRGNFYIFLCLLMTFNIFFLPIHAEENLILSDNITLKGSAAINDVLEKNTKLKIKLNQDISSEENKTGDEFSATILNDLNVNEINLIPVGSIIIGHIDDILHAGKRSMQATIDISLDKIILPSGDYIPLVGAKFATNKTHTNFKRNLKGEGSGLVKSVGLGFAKGATLSFIPGNKVVKSAAVGAAATGAVLSGGWSVTSTACIGALTGLYVGLKNHGKEVKIASGQELEIVLDEDQDLTQVAQDDIMDQGIQTVDSAETVIK